MNTLDANKPAEAQVGADPNEHNINTSPLFLNNHDISDEKIL